MSEKVYTVASVKSAESKLIENGVSEEQMIDRASSCIAGYLENEDDIVFLCGGGNNGSDGLLTALKLKDKKVTVFYGGNPNPINSALLEQVKKTVEAHPLYKYNGEGKVIVDCMLGTGISRPVTGDFAQAVRIANYTKAKKIAIDVPTGLDDTGMSLGDTFCADVTLAMGGIKTSDILNDALDFAGKVVLCDIGLPLENPIEVVSVNDVKIEKRKRNTHKGNYGKIKIIYGT
jgi:NAD(P)H-hydrate epimerase